MISNRESIGQKVEYGIWGKSGHEFNEIRIGSGFRRNQIHCQLSGSSKCRQVGRVMEQGGLG